MALACDYHGPQCEELGRAFALGRVSEDEASAERRSLADEIARCKKCIEVLS